MSVNCSHNIMQPIIDTLITLSGISLILTFIFINKKRWSWRFVCCFFGFSVASFLFTLFKLAYALF